MVSLVICCELESKSKGEEVDFWIRSWKMASIASENESSLVTSVFSTRRKAFTSARMKCVRVPPGAGDVSDEASVKGSLRWRIWDVSLPRMESALLGRRWTVLVLFWVGVERVLVFLGLLTQFYLID